MANTFLTLENATFLNKDYAFLNSALKALKFSVQLRKKKKRLINQRQWAGEGKVKINSKFHHSPFIVVSNNNLKCT